MDSAQMLEQLESQTAEEEQQREDAAEKKQAAAERKQQQLELGQQRQELRDLQRTTELPVLHLLQRLQFCGARSLALPLLHLKSGKVKHSAEYAATCSRAHGQSPETPRAGTPHQAPLLPSFMSILHVTQTRPSRETTA